MKLFKNNYPVLRRPLRLEKVLMLLLLFLNGIQIGSVYGQCGSALKFNESDDSYLWCENVSISNNFTMEFWVKPDRTIKTGMSEANDGFDGISGQSYAVYPDWYTTSSGETGAGVSVGTNGIAIFEHADNYMPARLVYYTSISSSVWTHIAVVYTNKKPSLYINGVWKETGSASPKDYVHPSSKLGDHTMAYGRFGGYVDEFRIWDGSLDETTIANWYNKTVTSSHPYYTDLYTWFKMDEGSGTSTADASGNNHQVAFYGSLDWADGWQTDQTDITIPECSINTSTTTIYLGYGDQTATLTGNGGGSYSWSGSNLSSNSNSSTIFTPTSGDGYYTIKLTTSNEYGCFDNCEVKICVLDIRATSGNSSNPKVYICHVPENNSENPQTLAVSVNSVNEHLSKHSNDKLGKCSQTCSSTLGKRSQDVPGTIYSVDKSSFIVYPNPSNGRYNFTLEGNSVEPLSIRKFDLAGRTVLEKTYADSEQKTSIDLSGFDSGIYSAELVQGSFRKIVKLVLQY